MTANLDAEADEAVNSSIAIAIATNAKGRIGTSSMMDTETRTAVISAAGRTGLNLLDAAYDALRESTDR